jgi:LCP family protein required for cell wall assembly
MGWTVSSDWPEGWFRGQRDGAGGPSDPTVRTPAPSYSRGAAGSGGAAGPGSAWPEQPPARSAGPGRAPGTLASGGRAAGGLPGEPGRRRRWLRPRRIIGVLCILVVLLLVAAVGFYFYLNNKLNRSDVLVDYSGRPAVSAGQNWLITGSDSRQGLTRQQELQYATGSLSDIGGQRSDTIMILHIPANGGRPVLISIPRDSYVPIPGYGSSKINAAFDAGGPQLLAETVQNATGLYINHYMGIGFGGFVNVVNAVGGVRMCLPAPLVDPKSGLNLAAGCQTLDGGQALGYVRTRDLFALSDLQREQDQRQFLKALLSKMTSAGTLANPFAAIPAATGTADALTVDQGATLDGLLHVAYALRNPVTTTVPLANLDYQTSNDGVAVTWNTTLAQQLFNDLRTDTPLPANLITQNGLTAS